MLVRCLTPAGQVVLASGDLRHGESWDILALWACSFVGKREAPTRLLETKARETVKVRLRARVYFGQ